MDASGRLLTLYAREWCSLCDDMYAALTPWRREHGFEVDIEFIDGDEALEARYGTRVPVLAEGDTEICQYFLDPEALRRHLGTRG